MTSLHLVLQSLKARKLNCILSISLTALGVMLAVLIILFTAHLESRIAGQAHNIDFVIGAKGSPLQLVLSTIYHVDIPTGNIPYDSAKTWMNNPQTKQAIPLALGDSYKRYRIVGTTPAYIDLYNGEFSSGKSWENNFEAVAGSDTGLQVGDNFSGAHGLTGEGHTHDNQDYTITGVLKSTGTVLDRLILTSVDSVLALHGMGHDDHTDHEEIHSAEPGHDHDDHAHAHEEEHHEHGHTDKEENGQVRHDDDYATNAEITALLIKARSPAAILNLPRLINRDTNLQAAIPSFEMARLTSMLGLGGQSLLTLVIILIVVSGLSIFAGIAGALDNRVYDLAVMRALGFSRTRLMFNIIAEAIIIVVAGLIIGVVSGHILFGVLINIIEALDISGADAAKFYISEIWLTLFILGFGIISSLLPAIKAGRLDAGRILSQR